MTKTFSIEEIAEIVHEVNVAYCQSQGDHSRNSWWNAEAWERESSIESVYLHLNNPNLKPEETHEAWMKSKTEKGWVYGPVRDSTALIHPCMLPYDQLPESERVEDHLQKSVINAFRLWVVTE